METNKNNIVECLNCHQPVDFNEILIKRFKDRYETEYRVRLSDLNSKNEEVNKKQAEIKAQEESINEKVQLLLSEKITLENGKLEKRIRDQVEQEKSEQIKSYEDQIQQKVQEARELNKVKAEFQKVKREKTELKDKLEAEMQNRLTEELGEARKKMKAEIESVATMKISEKEIIIQQLREQLMSAQKKVDQGSMQLQGEAQEKVIEAYLQENFPFDEVKEVGKGVKGGDCMHIIRNSTGDECGLIYYESKRSKEFQKAWIDKFKKDMRDRKADFGVLVTENYPKDMTRMGQRSGIWICSWEEFKNLCFVLRESVVLLHQAQLSHENKGGKMEMLYQYLIGPEFRGNIESVVEGFVQMNEDLARERRVYEGQWKQREKQIQKVLLNTSQLYHSIISIIQNLSEELYKQLNGLQNGSQE